MQIAAEGSEAFYEGETAERIVTASQSQGGILAEEDFIQYAVIESEPLECSYRGHQILTKPLPSGGTTLCQRLGIMEGFPLSELGHNTTEFLHRSLSVMLMVFADRNQ